MADSESICGPPLTPLGFTFRFIYLVSSYSLEINGNLELLNRRVYHFSPPYSLPPCFLDGVLRTEGKLLHLVKIGGVRGCASTHFSG
jgi:hypothetical protein